MSTYPLSFDPTEIKTNKEKLPKVTIITPNYNYGRFIESTILSVLSQNYPNLEYIVIDGKSTDDSLVIIDKYSDFLSYSLSETDHGQADAINKGLEKATGDIIAFINSDDLYTPNTLETVIKYFSAIDKSYWLVGSSQYVDIEMNNLAVYEPKFSSNLLFWLKRPFLKGKLDYPICPQPSVFLRREHIEKAGLFDVSLRYCFDHDYWCRLISIGYYPYAVSNVFSKFRVHPSSKTSSEGHKFDEEDLEIAEKYINSLSLFDRFELRNLIVNSRNETITNNIWYDIKNQFKFPSFSLLIKQSLTNPSLMLHRPWIGLLLRKLTNKF